MSLERATLELLEKIHARYVCVTCGNRGHEGKHEPDCEFFAVLKALRARKLQAGEHYRGGGK